MELSPVLLQWREEARQEGERVVIENLFKVRFGELDEQLATIIEPVMELPPEEFTQLLLQLSREELLTRFKRRFN